jgi:UDP-N-acetylmuramate--alanine ligase
MKHKIKQIHFIGIGGVGMSAIAEVLLNLGYRITGSDANASSATARLQQMGATVFIGHDPAYIAGAHCVVTSTAVKNDNTEVVAARAARIPVIARAMMLAELMKLKKGIAIAGTHGKTTTTSLIASVLTAGGFDPTFVIGGKLNSAGANAAVGNGEYVVVEADESDASFLNLSPVIAVITNIDADHMETYGHDFARLKQAFVEFTQRLPFYGSVVVCLDDQNIKEILPFVSKPVVTYGVDANAHVRAVEIKAHGAQMHFTVLRANQAPLSIVLNAPGHHNVLNALATIAVAGEVGVADTAVVSALAQFNGVGRRFQRYGEFTAIGGGQFTVIDDYGHHPVEMAATLAAVRGAFPGRRLVLAFQPHRYSRTRDCFDDFVKVMAQADVILLAPVYPAGETPIVAADSRALARALRVNAKIEPVFVEAIGQMPQAIIDNAKAGDVVITMGAGSIGQTPIELQNLYQPRAVKPGAGHAA